MPRFLKKRSTKVGLPPGSLVHIGTKKDHPPIISWMEYDALSFSERQIKSIDQLTYPKDPSKVVWVNVDGVHDIPMLEKIGGIFQIHPLVLEDIANTDQRPKLEDYEDYLYIVLRMLTYDDKADSIVSEQVSLVLGKNLVLSFQEQIEGDVFDPVRERMKKAKGLIRKLGPDYLTYSLLDSVIDHYFVILEKLGERIELLEEELVNHPGTYTLKILHRLKREMIYLRKSVWPLREVVGSLERGTSSLIQPNTQTYLRDIYDHTIQVIDTIETYRDMLSGMLDIYLSSLSNRMNEVMKVLTIIATLFMPITFIVGIYGMNFEHMPELKWRWAYPGVWMVMLGVVIFMLFYFRRKKWI